VYCIGEEDTVIIITSGTFDQFVFL